MRDEEFFRKKNLGAFFCPPARAKKSGFALQFLSPPAAVLRDFRFNPGCMGEQ
jgi:hypothetical protein